MADAPDIHAILTGTRRIAVVGVSANPARPSHAIFAFLVARGYDVVGVNPGLAGQMPAGPPSRCSARPGDAARHGRHLPRL